MTGQLAKGFYGRTVLVVEDEYFIASDLERSLSELGARVVGPAASIEAALELIHAATALDGAILDLNLRGEFAYPVADALMARDVPFVFATGYDQSAIPAAYAHVARCEKPARPARLAATLFA